jgi:hypothetical protein
MSVSATGSARRPARGLTGIRETDAEPVGRWDHGGAGPSDACRIPRALWRLDRPHRHRATAYRAGLPGRGSPAPRKKPP